MRMRLLCVLLLLFSFHSNGFGQDINFTGTVADAENGDLLVGVHIQTANQQTATDEFGNFNLTLPLGIHELTLSYVGYKTLSVPIDFGKNQNQLFELSPTSIQLKTATISSGKFEKPLGEVTVSLTVIKPGELEAHNDIGLDETLKRIPGVDVLDGQPSIRGGAGYSYGAGSRVLLLVDGLPALQADAGFPNWKDIPMETVGQIEIIKGAASALYGSSAINGIIHLQSNFPTSTPKSTLNATGNLTLAPRKTSTQWWNSPPLEFSIGGSHRKKFGKLDFIGGANFTQIEEHNQNDVLRGLRTNATFRYRQTDSTNFGISYNIKRSESSSFLFWRDGDEGVMQPNADDITESKSWRFYLDPFFKTYDSFGNKHNIQGRYYFVDNDVNNDFANRSAVSLVQYQFQRFFNSAHAILTAGLNASYNTATAALYGGAKYTTDNEAFFLQWDQKLGSKLNIAAGVRLESNLINAPDTVNEYVLTESDPRETKPVFRLGLNYQLGEYTYLRASWGQGYRFPTIAEKYIQTGFGGLLIYPNPELKSETGWTAELGVRQGLQFGNWRGFLDASVFWNQYQDMMEFTAVNLTQGPGFQSLNVGNTRIFGTEFNIFGGVSWGKYTWYSSLGYVFIDPRFLDFTEELMERSTSSENILKYRHEHTFKFNTELKRGAYFIGVDNQLRSAFKAIDRVFDLFIPGVQDFRESHDRPIHVVNARIGRHFNDDLKVSFLAKNLFNLAYSDRPGLLESPINLTLRLDWTF